MKVSVIVPVFNVSEYLSRCLDSILAEKKIQIEVVLVNDGSTDGSEQLCDFYAKLDSRVIVIHQENHGVSVARNVGISYSTGDYICFVDGDDWIELSSISKCLHNHMVENVDLLIARTFINNGKNLGVEHYAFDNIIMRDALNERALDLLHSRRYLRGSACGVFYRASFLKGNNIEFPENLLNGEDTIFFTLSMIYANQVRFRDVHFYNIYERHGSASRSWSFERILKMLDSITYVDNYIINNQQLSLEAVQVLEYLKYRFVSIIFNNFHNEFSLTNYAILKKSLVKIFNGKIAIRNYGGKNRKIDILNFSVEIFAMLILLKNKVLH